MPVYVSFHSANSKGPNVPKYNLGATVNILGPGTTFESKTPAATANNFTETTENCFVRIVTHGSNANIALVANTLVANSTNTEYWPDGTVEVRFLPKNYRISILT